MNSAPNSRRRFAAQAALSALLLTATAASLRAAGAVEAAASPAARAPGLFPTPPAPVMTALSDLLGTETGQGLMRADPFWAGAEFVLRQAPDTAARMLAPIVASLPQSAVKSLPDSLTLGDIDSRPERVRAAMIEDLAAAHARAVPAVETAVKQALARNDERDTIQAWVELEEQLAPLSRYSDFAAESTQKAHRMVQELKRLKAEAAMAEAMQSLTLVQERDEDGRLVVHDMHLYGNPAWKGVVADLKMAIFDKDKTAMRRLGFRNEAGWEGLIPKDSRRAADWYGQAANVYFGVVGTRDGDPQAQLSLGRLYEQGSSVPQSLGHAYQLYALAANQGLLEARPQVARLERAMDRRALADAQQSIAYLLKKPEYRTVPQPVHAERQLGELMGLRQRRTETSIIAGIVAAAGLATSLGLDILFSTPLPLWSVLLAFPLYAFPIYWLIARPERRALRDRIRQALTPPQS